jgi:sigma-B regulation protein RsbU (phosphoserine phosphatase)
MTLRRQMIVWIAGPILVIYVFILGLTAVGQYRQSKQEVERAMMRLAASYAARLDGYLREVSRIALTASTVLGSGVELSDAQIYTLLENNVDETPLVYGSCLAFEPGTRRAGDELFAPYVCRGPHGLERMNIDRSVYDWYRDPQFTWYQRPKQLSRGVWSEPYFDKGAGNILMSTYSAPFSHGDSFGGVCTVDIDLPRLRETVGREFDERFDFVIVAADGRYVFHPDATRILARTVFDYLDEAGRGSQAPAIKQIVAGESSSAWIDGWDSGEAIGVFSAPIPSTDWMFVARVPTSQVLADVRRRTVTNGAALVATMLLVCGAIYAVAGRIAAPISALERAVLKVGGGDLETRIDELASTTEIQNLAASFNRMTVDLRAHVDRLAVEKAARQRIEHDLEIARGIQQGLLPTTRPDLPGYDIAGWSQAANETGGDYYDWQVLPDGRVLVSLADVSGHGVGPALVAAVCRAYARASVTGNDQDLGKILDRINALLSADMPDGRFVTFVGVLLDPATHGAQMVSAGHGPLFRCIASHGELVESGADGIPFGLLPDSEYGPVNEFSLAPGDSVLLVTDGLFEWTNAAGESYGLERLRESILKLSDESAADIIRGLFDGARSFIGDLPQEDDVTIVVVRRCIEAS